MTIDQLATIPSGPLARISARPSSLGDSRAIMRFAPVLLVSIVFCAVSSAADFKYIRQGNPHDVQTRAEAGVAMMGGGEDLDEAFRWLCGRANGGDFLILRAHGGADYNPY